MHFFFLVLNPSLSPSFLQSHCSLNLSAGLAFDDSQSLHSSEFGGGGAGFVPGGGGGGGPDADEEKQSVSD